jgi:hypothetical protein
MRKLIRDEEAILKQSKINKEINKRKQNQTKITTKNNCGFYWGEETPAVWTFIYYYIE